jgi:N6-adenosine-specific RNA methylase IME4
VKYDLIYLDPPWPYNSRCAWSETKFGGGTTRQYPTMDAAQLFELGPLIEAVASDSCAMVCWYTAPHLATLLDFLAACGFAYKTKAFCWVKTNKDGTPFAGPGFYTASNTEDAALAVRVKRGQPAPKPAARLVNQVVEHPEEIVVREGRREHSRKPDVVRERLERMYPDARKLEIFCRFPAPGWTSLGNEIDGLDIRVALRLAATGYYSPWRSEHVG